MDYQNDKLIPYNTITWLIKGWYKFGVESIQYLKSYCNYFEWTSLRYTRVYWVLMDAEPSTCKQKTHDKQTHSALRDYE